MDKTTTINNAFATWYAAYEYPFELTDAWLASAPLDKKVNYLREAKRIAEGDVLKRELQGLQKKFIDHLAVGATSEDERLAYRITLLFMKQFQERIAYLASQYRVDMASDDPENEDLLDL